MFVQMIYGNVNTSGDDAPSPTGSAGCFQTLSHYFSSARPGSPRPSGIPAFLLVRSIILCLFLGSAKRCQHLGNKAIWGW